MTIQILSLALLIVSGTTGQEVRIGNGSEIQSPRLTLPKLVTYKRPAYSEEARRRGIEGVVTVQAEFDANGGFRLLRLVKGLGYGLDENALEAMKHWQFTPAYRDGQRIRIVTQIDISFFLVDDPVWLRQNTNPREEERRRKFSIDYIRDRFERWEVN